MDLTRPRRFWIAKVAFTLAILVIACILEACLVLVQESYRFFVPENYEAVDNRYNGRHAGIRRGPGDDEDEEGVIMHPPLQDQPPPAAQ